MRVNPTVIVIFGACVGLISALISSSNIQYPLVASTLLSALIGVGVYAIARFFQGRRPEPDETEQ